MNASRKRPFWQRLRAHAQRWADEDRQVRGAALHHNLSHLSVATWVMLALNLVHVGLFAQLLDHPDPVRAQWAQGILWAHVCMAVLMLAAGLLVRHALRQPSLPRLMHCLPEGMALVALLWSVVLTVLDQAVTTNISAYLNACAAVAVVLLLPPQRALMLFVLAWVLVSVGLMLVTVDVAVLLTNRVNATTATALAMTVSLLLWRKFTRVELLQTALTESNRKLQRQQAELQMLATRDALTGLCNRREFIHQAEQALARAQRDHTPLSLLMLDLDHFKTINDRFGHPVGDAVLQHVAQLMAQSVRQTDCVARWGGEEFILLLPNTDATSAHTLADKLRLHLADHPLRAQDGSPAVPPAIPITTSIGLVCVTVHQTRGLDELVSLADQALYRAKALGRNRVERVTDADRLA